MTRIKNVILDLDNTIISAEAQEEFPFKDDGIREKALKFKFWDMDGYFIVFERPNLESFLDFLFENYNVSVWTAATKDYALFIIDKIILSKPNRHLNWILCSYHCDLSHKKYESPKQLDMLWDVFNLNEFNEKNTIIIDDLIDVHESQPDKCIRIKEFNILEKNSEYDDELNKIKTKLEKL